LDKAGLWIAGVLAIGGAAWLVVCLIGGIYGVFALVGIVAVGIGLLIREQKRMNDDER